MKKNFAALALAVAMAATLAGCSSSATETEAPETETAAETTAEAENTEAAEAETEAEAEAAGDSAFAGQTLIMATNAEFPPYEYHDGNEIVGIDVDIARAICEEMGAELEITDIAFDSIIPEIQADKADFGAAGMTVTEDRQSQVDFSDTYATGVQSVIVPEGSEIQTIEDLSGKLIGVQQGTTGDIYASDDFGDENVQRFPKGADAVQALVNGKIDAVIIDNKPAQVFVSENEGLVILETAYAEEEYAIAVKKGNTELLDAINASIASLKESGTLDEIVAKYVTAE